MYNVKKLYEILTENDPKNEKMQKTKGDKKGKNQMRRTLKNDTWTKEEKAHWKSINQMQKLTKTCVIGN